MARHLTRARLIGEILAGTKEGASVGDLRQQSCASHHRISGVLRTLVERGLMERTGYKANCRYRISSRGRDFLREYNEFRAFTESYGIAI